MTTALNEIRETTRRFVRKELLPHENQVEEFGEIPETILKKLREAGFFGITLPREYGGAELPLPEYLAVVQEFGRTNWAFFGAIDDNNGMGSELIIKAGTSEQRQRVLPRLATGEALACFALTEPDAGSDAAGIQTTARRERGGYVINGRKRFISNACKCEYFTVIARTGDGSGPGYTAFLIERDTPGFSIGPAERLMAWRGACQHELILDDCRVPESARLGDEGEGLSAAYDALKVGRLVVAAWALGAGERALELGISYATQRRQFGQPIGEFQGIQWHLAESATEVAAANALLETTAQRVWQGTAKMREAAYAKLFATEVASRVADRMIQVHGGVGLSRDLPLERILRDVRVCRIIEGTTEIQKMIIAKSLLREASGN